MLVATSGDTGGAVANGFYNVEGVDVVILYPSGKVSSVQELQLTTLGKNIKALEIDGTFDDCQQMVKQAFADDDLNKKLISHFRKFHQCCKVAAATILLFLCISAMG